MSDDRNELSSSSSSSQEEDDILGPAHSSKCHRHLSRIARDILRKDALPIILRQHPFWKRSNKDPIKLKQGQVKDETMEEDYWDILREVIDQHGTTSQCLLSPERDIFHGHERHSSIVSSSLSSSSSRGGQGDLHKCGFCQKQFVSRYYLDHHLDKHHSHIIKFNNDTTTTTTNINKNNENNTIDWICPATDLCPILTGSIHGCEELAARSPVYYGPGRPSSPMFMGHTTPPYTDSWKSISMSMTPNDFFHHHLHHNGHHHPPPPKPTISYSCHESTMVLYKQQCYSMIYNCFGTTTTTTATTTTSTTTTPSLSNELISHICDRLTCSEKIHTLAAGQEQHTLHVHATKELWETHHDFRLGFLGWCTMIAIGCISMTIATFGSGRMIGRKKNRRPPSFLLRNRKQKTL